MNLSNVDFINDILVITNDNGLPIFIPEEVANEEEKAIITEFKAAYPDGKPEPIVEPQTPVPTDIEIVQQQIAEAQSYAATLSTSFSEFMDYVLANMPTS